MEENQSTKAWYMKEETERVTVSDYNVIFSLVSLRRCPTKISSCLSHPTHLNIISDSYLCTFKVVPIMVWGFHNESWCWVTMKKAVSTSVIRTFLSLMSIPNYLSKASWTWIDVSTSMKPPSSLQWVLNENGTPYICFFIYIPSFGVVPVEPGTNTVDDALCCQSRLNIRLYTFPWVSEWAWGNWNPYLGTVVNARVTKRARWLAFISIYKIHKLYS